MILASMATSIDGRYGGPDRELDWQSFDDEFRAYSNELLTAPTASCSAASRSRRCGRTGPRSRARRSAVALRRA